MFHYRPAEGKDREALLDLIAAGFAARDTARDHRVGEAHRVLFSYLYQQPDWNPGWVYLAEKGRRLAAAVGVFPRQLSFEGTYLDIWAVSPVVTHPLYRGVGAAAGCLRVMFADLKTKGITAVFLWGIPQFYPRFGFVPVLSRYKTKLVSGQTRKVSAKVDGGLRRIKAGSDDAAQIGALYASTARDLWLQPLRTSAWWRRHFQAMGGHDAIVHEIPFPKEENFKVWENNRGEVGGYFYFYEVPAEKRVYVTEAAAAESDAAGAMLRAFIKERRSDTETLIIRGTPAHHCNTAAYQMGGMHLNPAPSAGMFKVLDWPEFLNALAPVLNERINNILKEYQIELNYNEARAKITLTASGPEIRFNYTAPDAPDYAELNRVLTRLALGVYDQSDLARLAGSKIQKYLPLLFPRKYPFIWDADYLY